MRLLDDMGELMRQEVPARVGVWAVRAAAEVDVVAVCEGVSVNGGGSLRGHAICVHTHVPKISPEPGLKVAARRVLQRSAGACSHGLECGGEIEIAGMLGHIRGGAVWRVVNQLGSLSIDAGQSRHVQRSSGELVSLLLTSIAGLADRYSCSISERPAVDFAAQILVIVVSPRPT